MGIPFSEVKDGQKFKDASGRYLIKIEATTRIDKEYLNCVDVLSGVLMYEADFAYCELVKYRVRPMEL